MKVTIEWTQEEIASLVVAIQGKQSSIEMNGEIISQVLLKSNDDIGPKDQEKQKGDKT